MNRSGGKGQIRALNRKGSRSDKAPPVAHKSPGLGPAGGAAEPAACESCGAVFVRKTWRRDHRISSAFFAKVRWIVCPACRQVASGEYYGRVVLKEMPTRGDEADLKRRIRKVEARAGFTQPERRIVSVERQGSSLEVLTTSAKLAHRIAREVEKAFGGRTSYSWSDDGSLLAVWQETRAAR